MRQLLAPLLIWLYFGARRCWCCYPATPEGCPDSLEVDRQRDQPKNNEGSHVVPRVDAALPPGAAMAAALPAEAPTRPPPIPTAEAGVGRRALRAYTPDPTDI